MQKSEYFYDTKLHSSVRFVWVFFQKTYKGNVTIKHPSGMKIKDFSHNAKTMHFPLLFPNKTDISVKLTCSHIFSTLDNFNGKNISLITFIWFKEREQTL